MEQSDMEQSDMERYGCLLLKKFFREHPSGVLGFSGGCDSAFLLYAALDCGARVRPCYVKTPFQPEGELVHARRFSESLGVPLEVIELDILSDSLVACNSARRCYFCKKHIFSAVARRAFRDGLNLIMDGSNASDAPSERPGMRALSELSVRSPLRECGLSKNDVRRLSRKAGLSTWDKPADSCLATRVKSGETLTVDVLCRVEKAEAALKKLGFSNFRVRISGNHALAQFSEKQLDRALSLGDTVTGALEEFFARAEVDPHPRLVTRE